jgi:glycosyltransferase involved in cell wall biosynthesis
MIVLLDKIIDNLFFSCILCSDGRLMIPVKSRTIKIAMIAQDYLPLLGGAERQISALAPLFKERGVEVQVLTRRYPGLLPFEVMDNVPVYRLPILKTKPLASLSFTIAGIPLLKKLQPDIIHAHGLLSPTTMAVIANYLWDIPVVSKSLRGGILGDYQRLIKRPLGRYRYRMIQSHVDAFIAISNEIKDEFLGSGSSPQKCKFIPNGVKLDRFQPINAAQKLLLRKQLKLPEGTIVIFAGRLEQEKRVEDLVKLWLQVQEKHSDAHLLILGTGSQETMLKKMATGNIHFGGTVEDVAPYLQTSDIFVLPSVAEGLSNALLEALATELPVVVTATGGTTDIVRHKVSGWLIENYTPQALLEGILSFLDDRRLRERCAREGRRCVTENYSLKNTADRLYELYHELLSK